MNTSCKRVDSNQSKGNEDILNKRICLLKKFINRNFLLKCWEKDLLFNFKVLSRSINLFLFNVTFPREILFFLNNLYFELRKESIGDEINQENICSCEETCLEFWYDPELHRKFNDYDKALTIKWNLYHCNVMYYDEEYCHNIFFYGKKKKDRKNGFECTRCDRICCRECRVEVTYYGDIDRSQMLKTRCKGCDWDTDNDSDSDP
jgi:hypothetical protein